jgi:hypothetical protein
VTVNMTDDQLAALWQSGSTLTEIGRMAGKGRGSVGGRIFRLRRGGDQRFSPRASGPKPKPTEPRAVKPNLRPAPKPIVVAMLVAEPIIVEAVPAGGVTLLELTPSSCRFPTRELAPRTLLYCGRQVAAPSSPWCPMHAKIVWGGSRLSVSASAFSASLRAAMPPGVAAPRR